MERAGGFSLRPKVLSAKSFESLRGKAQYLGRGERDAAMEAAEMKKERLVRESMERKAELHRVDLDKRRKDARLSEVEAEARKQTMHILERAYNLKLEREEEIQRCNKIILETKCRAIRDAQICERKVMEKELAEEEQRFNTIAERERRLKIAEEECREREEREKRQRFAKVLKEQITEMEAQRMLEIQRKQEESRLIHLSNAAWKQEEALRLEKKEAEQARVRLELSEGNEQLKHFKELEKQENRIIDLRIQEFQREKFERQAKLAEEMKAEKRRKDREKLRLDAQTRQTKDLQATIDEFNAARIQEEVEREWRRKEREATLKRIEEQQRLNVLRAEQIRNKRIMQAMEIEREKREFQRCVAAQKEAASREAAEEERKRRQALVHRSEILKQVNEKERERVLVRQKIFQEGEAIRAEHEMRAKQLREAMRRKCEEMRDNKVPEIYVNEVKRLIDTVK